jgi:succinate dehydrogenase / fumarate reductase flavoprotein subunit
VQSELQDVMQNLVGIVRTESEMQQAIEKVEALRKRAEKAGITGNIEYNNGWHTAMDLENMLSISEMIAMSGLERQESRGGHFREDYPNKSEEWGKFNLRLTKGGDGRPKMERVPVVPLTEEMKQIIEEQKS